MICIGWMIFRCASESQRFLAIFRSYLVGDEELKRYAKDDDDRDLATEKIVSIKGGPGGQWVMSTPDLREIVFGIRRIEDRRAGYNKYRKVEGYFVGAQLGERVVCEVWRAVGK
jgi:hypothetical protein